MEAIKPLWNTMPLTKPEGTTKASVDGITPFTDLFTTAIDAVKETNAEHVELEYLLATGQLDNPAVVNIAAEKELQATTLLVQLRNTAMDAYNEIMRINL